MKKLLALTAAAAGLALADTYHYLFCRDAGWIIKHPMERVGHRADYYVHRDSTAEDMGLLRRTRYTMPSVMGGELCGYYYPCGEKPTGKIAFIVHGFRSEHLETAGMYREYYMSRGFDIFACDNIAHGESYGRHIGYDLTESEDCLRWLSLLRREYGEDIQVILHGFSMGGATVLKMSDRCPDCVKFIVSDSGFSSGAEILKPRLKVLYKPMDVIHRAVTGHWLEETDVRDAVRASKTPILFVHGGQDHTVPTAMGSELYALCNSAKDILLVPGARHVESMHVAPKEYAEKLDTFIQRYIK